MVIQLFKVKDEKIQEDMHARFQNEEKK